MVTAFGRFVASVEHSVYGRPDPMTVDAPVLEVDSVSMEFGGLKALQDVSLSVHKGDIVGVIGPNGAGKTTLLNVISGHLQPTRGTVSFDGVSIRKSPPHMVARRGLARSFQDTQSFPSLTVYETVLAAALNGRGLREAREEVDRILDEVGLSAKAHSYQSGLSLPDRKLVELAKCIAMDPKLLLLDEVMAGLTMAECEEPLKVITDLQSKGVSIVLIEHVMPVIMRIATRIVVLDFGQRILEGTPQEVVADERVRASYLGGKASA